jgi:hypothetical protein
LSDSILLKEADEEEEDGEETSELEEELNSDRRTFELGAQGIFVNELMQNTLLFFMITFIIKNE